jgi:hypothetical protein
MKSRNGDECDDMTSATALLGRIKKGRLRRIRKGTGINSSIRQFVNSSIRQFVTFSGADNASYRYSTIPG